MEPLQWSFAEMLTGHITANSFNNYSPTTITGGDIRPSYSKSPLNERAVAILAAITIPNDESVDLPAESGGKQSLGRDRKGLKNRKKRKKHTVPRAGHRVGKSKKNSAIAATSSGPGRKPRSKRMKKAQKLENERIRSARENIERKEWLESWLDSENKRKGEEAMSGLVGLMEGFGICAGEKVQEMTKIEGVREGVADVGGLEMQMATLEVMAEDGGDIS